MRVDRWNLTTLFLIAAAFFCFAIQNKEVWNSSRSTHLTSDHLTSLLGLDCPCKSLFSIGACGLDDIVQKNPRDKKLKESLKHLKLANKGFPVSAIHELKYLSRYFPNKFSFNVTQPINRLHFPPPYVPCHIHIYNESEISTCVKRRYELTGRKLKIAFVGDSLVRNLMERMVIHLGTTLNIAAAGESGMNLTINFLDHTLKHFFPAEGDGIELRLHWSVELGKDSEKDQRSSKTTYQGARDILQAWAQNVSVKGAVPDIIYFDDGMWSSVMRLDLDAFEQVRADIQAVLPFLKTLSQSSLLLFRAETPTKSYLVLKRNPNSILDLIDQYTRSSLSDSGVWVWDSAIPLYLKEFEECMRVWRATGGNKTRLPKDWSCFDYQHPSKTAEAVAENIMWNLVCNRLMKVDSGHCCS